jgi:ADP-ribosylglycohydrolase
MTDDLRKAVPEGARKVIEALVGQVLARCDRLGIPREVFYREMIKEQKLHPEVSVMGLFERTFQRLGRTPN